MEIADAIKQRRVIREFKQDPVPDDILYRIIDSARWAPSPFNTQPWEFIIIRNSETLKKLAKCAPTIECNAPMAIAVVILPITARYPFHQQVGEPGHAGAMAVQNIMLTAWELGIGTAWTTIEKDKVKQILNIPEEFDVLTVIPMGYPMEEPPMRIETDRLPVEDLMNFEKFTGLSEGRIMVY
ncbi:MAG: nitroreductase family protein [Methanosarcinales archaeon]|nr:nitroreductase family protein [ANME-2 cluster archaeon]MDF1532098.1 nitroreductase family protein [ANME-2 cluster archaeon]MDW7776996.1 nitroreductase family protein [Methanosarcinales archaeon]